VDALRTCSRSDPAGIRSDGDALALKTCSRGDPAAERNDGDALSLVLCCSRGLDTGAVVGRGKDGPGDEEDELPLVAVSLGVLVGVGGSQGVGRLGSTIRPADGVCGGPFPGTPPKDTLCRLSPPKLGEAVPLPVTPFPLPAPPLPGSVSALVSPTPPDEAMLASGTRDDLGLAIFSGALLSLVSRV